MGPFEQRGCAIRQAAPRCSNPEIAGAASDISNERKLRLVYRVLTKDMTDRQQHTTRAGRASRIVVTRLACRPYAELEKLEGRYALARLRGRPPL